MTRSETTWTMTINEGGEGYNPHQIAREDAEWAAAKAEADARRDTLEGRIGALDREINTIRAAEPWSDARDAKIAALTERRKTLEAELQARKDAAFAAEWTLEVTKERRAAWNQLVRSGELSKWGKIDLMAVRDQEERQGWTMSDLQHAIKLHNL